MNAAAHAFDGRRAVCLSAKSNRGGPDFIRIEIQTAPFSALALNQSR
jgi:hypothetical protein